MVLKNLKTDALQKACKEFGVKKLYVFGSAVDGHFNSESDLDFLVEFDRYGYEGAFDQFMGLKDSLEKIFNRSVDLITEANLRNEIFLKEIAQSKKLLYAA